MYDVGRPYFPFIVKCQGNSFPIKYWFSSLMVYWNWADIPTMINFVLSLPVNHYWKLRLKIRRQKHQHYVKLIKAIITHISRQTDPWACYTTYIFLQFYPYLKLTFLGEWKNLVHGNLQGHNYKISGTIHAYLARSVQKQLLFTSKPTFFYSPHHIFYVIMLLNLDFCFDVVLSSWWITELYSSHFLMHCVHVDGGGLH